ncbi:MAG TPA: hypothetical protein VKN63_06280 [Afifellaceae bacterium]|nr:hypothetical protein [Afifellaceae bacterium]
MKFLLWILLAGLGLSLAILLTSAVSASPRIRAASPWALAVLAGYGVSYVLALILVTVRPIWVTNGVEVWANFPEHFLWALPATAITQFVGVPAALVAFAVQRRRRLPD